MTATFSMKYQKCLLRGMSLKKLPLLILPKPSTQP
jgi:hypothetical protein